MSDHNAIPIPTRPAATIAASWGAAMLGGSITSQTADSAVSTAPLTTNNGVGHTGHVASIVKRNGSHQ